MTYIYDLSDKYDGFESYGLNVSKILVNVINWGQRSLNFGKIVVLHKKGLKIMNLQYRDLL